MMNLYLFLDLRVCVRREKKPTPLYFFGGGEVCVLKECLCFIFHDKYLERTFIYVGMNV